MLCGDVVLCVVSMSSSLPLANQLQKAELVDAMSERVAKELNHSANVCAGRLVGTKGFIEGPYGKEVGMEWMDGKD